MAQSQAFLCALARYHETKLVVVPIARQSNGLAQRQAPGRQLNRNSLANLYPVTSAREQGVESLRLLRSVGQFDEWVEGARVNPQAQSDTADGHREMDDT